MRRAVIVIILSMLMLSCSTIDQSSYSQFESATRVAFENSKNLFSSLESLEKQNYTDAVSKDEKDLYVLKYDIDAQRQEIFLDSIFDHRRELHKIHSTIMAYAAALVSIADPQSIQLTEDSQLMLQNIESISDANISDNQSQLFSLLTDEIERSQRSEVLSKVISNSTELITQLCNAALQQLEEIEEITYFIYDKRFSDVYENFILDPNEEKVLYIFDLNSSYRRNRGYLTNMKRIYTQLPQYHASLVRDVSGIIEYAETISEYHFNQDASVWTQYIQF